MKSAYDLARDLMNTDTSKTFDPHVLLTEAKALPDKESKILSLMPVIIVLREEKKLDWTTIGRWLHEKTGFNHSGNHWMVKYKAWVKEQHAQEKV